MGPVALSGRRDRRRLLAISVLGATMLIATVVVALGLLSTPGDAIEGDAPFIAILFAGLWLYWGLGTLIVVRSDGHLVGWLFAVAAALMATMFSCFALGFALSSSQPPHPLSAWLSLAGSLLFPPAIILILPAVALTFPTGTLPGPRWRWPVRLIAAMVALRMLATVIWPGPMGDGPVNPLTPALPAFLSGAHEILRTLEAIGSLSLPLGAVLGVAAVVVRFRRAQGDERQQLKWFLAAMVPAAVLLPLSISGVLRAVPIIGLLSVATLPLIPVSVAVAILRYRLYDIDRIISRTIAYAVVSGILAIVFGGVILLLSAVLAQFAQGQTIAVAASTLAAYAVFQPVLQRVRRNVDRRFNRARYDAEQTAAAFSARMRNEVDIGAVTADLNSTVHGAIKPASLGLWIRESRP